VLQQDANGDTVHCTSTVQVQVLTMEPLVDHGDKKQSRKHSRNPLSHARGRQQSHESVWFRRTGAGYHLFVQYYAGQPNGTVAEANHELVSADAKTTLPTPTTSSCGLSRASKRRKKRKMQVSSNHDEKQEYEYTCTSTCSQPQDKKEDPPSPSVTDHPLLAAMTSCAAQAGLQSFLSTLARPLPVTFRIRRHLNDDVVKNLQEHIPREFSNLVQPIHNLLYLYLYQVPHCAKADLGKRHPKLKQFLLEGSQNGTLARQELGSMLPLLALEQAKCFSSFSSNKNRKYRILDLCASPGSKTLQALELMTHYSKHDNDNDNDNDNATTKGRILANDVSESRLDALKQAIQRSGMPRVVERIGYSCHDARHLSTTKPWDIVICDVPCSGDGTIRKDPHIVQLWKPSQGHVLHTTQLSILKRAMQLVKVGGTICYSTCSLNPIENEAVVAAALQHYHQQKQKQKQKHPDNANANANCERPAMELLLVPDIQGLTLRPGLTTWKVADYRDVAQEHNNDDDETPQLCWYETFEGACGAKMPDAVRSMWPQRENNDRWHLERCMRLWPQDHDSGGFFLTLIRRNR
jgi:16S rRNA C967 or C1407 C5-methylase (RsmB/RsmF family)